MGIFGNTIVSFIIAHKEMRNSFNLLLVSLACFDSTYVSKNALIKFLEPRSWVVLQARVVYENCELDETLGHLKHCKHGFKAETFFGRRSLNMATT